MKQMSFSRPAINRFTIHGVNSNFFDSGQSRDVITHYTSSSLFFYKRSRFRARISVTVYFLWLRVFDAFNRRSIITSRDSPMTFHWIHFVFSALSVNILCIYNFHILLFDHHEARKFQPHYIQCGKINDYTLI